MEHSSDTAGPEDEADRVQPAAGETGDPAAEGAHVVNEAVTMHAERGFRPESGRRRTEHPPAAEEPRAPLRCARAIPAPSRCC